MNDKIPEKTERPNDIRVKIKLPEELTIPIDKDIVLVNSDTNKIVKVKPKQNEVKLKFVGGKSYINDSMFDYTIFIFNRSNGYIKINDSLFYGNIFVTPKESEIEVINILPVEKYLFSVVPSEMPLSFPLEALKAQAVIARTYSYYFIAKYRDARNFDVDNTIMYQVYNGFDFKSSKEDLQKLEKALEETKNLIVTYDKKPILAYFHSNSGGKIRSGLDYFGKNSDFKYLVAKDDPYSLGEKNDKWTNTLAIDLFKKKLGIVGDLTNDVTLEMFSYNKDGFVDRFSYDNKNKFTAKEIRKNIGYFELKSERFKVELDSQNLLFLGIGFGHGVGLSQYGAKGMASKNFNYKEIIGFYYPETTISKYNIE